MLLPASEYRRATSLLQAAPLLAENPEARALAGGTDLLVDLRERRRTPPVLVDVSELDGLRGIAARAGGRRGGGGGGGAAGPPARRRAGAGAPPGGARVRGLPDPEQGDHRRQPRQREPRGRPRRPAPGPRRARRARRAERRAAPRPRS